MEKRESLIEQAFTGKQKRSPAITAHQLASAAVVVVSLLLIVASARSFYQGVSEHGLIW